MKIIQKISTILLTCVLFLFVWLYQVSWEELLENEKQETVQKLSLQWVEVVDMDVLKISFWVNIDDSREKDFIVKSLPIWNEIEVTQILVDENDVLLSIEEDFISDKQYEVVIISLYGVDWSTIVSWIDGAVEFSAPDMEQFKLNISGGTNDSWNWSDNDSEGTNNIWDWTNNSSGGTNDSWNWPDNNSGETNNNWDWSNNSSAGTNDSWNNNLDTEVELNSADEKETTKTKEEKATEQEELNKIEEEKVKTVAEKIEEANKKNNSVNLWWKAVSQEELDKNVSVAAGKTEDLPTTWPEHIFFIVLAIILAWLVLHTRSKKI